MPNIIIFAEDPGAALFLRDLPAVLRGRGATPVVVAGPFAAAYFHGEQVRNAPTVSAPEVARELLRELNADVVVTGTSENPDSLAFDLIHAARAAGIPSFGAVDSPPNAEYRFRGRADHPLAHLPDFILLPDRSSEAAYRRLGVMDERITVCGHPQLHAISRLRSKWGEAERQQHRARWFPHVPEDRPIFSFASELSVGLGDAPFRKTADYRLHGTSGSEARGDIVAEEFLRAARNHPARPHLVLRLHPKQTRTAETRLAALFDQVSQDEPALEVAHAADIVAGMTSILLAEAYKLGRPVLSIVPRPEERAWLGDLADKIACVWETADIAAYLGGHPIPTPMPEPEVGDPAQVMADRILQSVTKVNCAAICVP